MEAGINRNAERYSTDAENLFSWEGYLGTDLNLFSTGDFSLTSQIKAYPGITEKGRWRVDSSLDLKYDLPYDLYIKIGGSLNFDNRQTNEADKTDYIIQSGIGWEW